MCGRARQDVETQGITRSVTPRPIALALWNFSSHAVNFVRGVIDLMGRLSPTRAVG